MSGPGLRRLPPRLLAAACVLGLPALLLAAMRGGPSGTLPFGTLLEGAAAAFGWGAPLDEPLQTIVELRLWRVLTAAGVGAALSLSGALLQGLFRNGLAAPSILGVTGGASLGAALAIVALAGWGPALVSVGDLGASTALVPLAGFLGALGAVLLVTLLASTSGRVSVPALLLIGIAVNACIAGLLALISSLALQDWEVSRAILAWTFGTLEDRAPGHAATVGAGLLCAALVIPFVAWELDLLAAGDEDARAAGVSVVAVRWLVVLGSSLAAAAAVAVAGQIAFVGLVVPHITRRLAGRSHRAVLPLSPLVGAVFLVGVDLLQRTLLGSAALQPGVTMSLIGGPFFLALLLLSRREVDSW